MSFEKISKKKFNFCVLISALTHSKNCCTQCEKFRPQTTLFWFCRDFSRFHAIPADP